MWRLRPVEDGGDSGTDFLPLATSRRRLCFNAGAQASKTRRSTWLNSLGFRPTLLVFSVSAFIIFILTIMQVFFNRHTIRELDSRRRSGDGTKGAHSRVTRHMCERLTAGYPLVCAHGGDTSRAPPNTAAAFRLALSINVGCIEIDSSRTADGVLVALHDRDLQAFSGRKGLRVGEVTFEQLLSMDAGAGFAPEFRGQKVMTLYDALQEVSGSLSTVIVDVKVGLPWGENGLAQDTLSEVRKAGCTNCLLWAKSDAIVRDLKRLDPSYKAGYIVMKDVSGRTRRMDDALRIEAAEVIGVEHTLVNKAFLSNARRGGKEIHAWTVNTEEEMEKMVQEGVDGVITNYPRMLQFVITRYLSFCEHAGFS